MAIPKALRRLIRPSILGMNAYMPSADLNAVAAAVDRSAEDVIKLDSNENPYGTTIRVQEALASFDRYHRFPDADQRRARSRIAAYAGAPFERIIIGNGIDELIDLILMATIDPGDEVLVPIPTAGVYAQRPPLFNGVSTLIERRTDLELDIEAVERAVTERTKVIFVASPNNPTGDLVSQQQLVRLLRTGVLVVVDEDYVEFASKSLLPYTGEFENMIVLRSFGTWAGLAGMRLGYGVFPPSLAAELWKVKQPFNVSAAGLMTVEAALDDQEYLMEAVRRIRVERGRLYRSLRKLNFLQPYPSQGNFILCRVTRGDAHQIQHRLARRGILVRQFDTLDLRRHLRITVGRPEETDALMAALLGLADQL